MGLPGIEEVPAVPKGHLAAWALLRAGLKVWTGGDQERGCSLVTD